MTNTYFIRRTELVATCERWVSLSPQKRAAVIRKCGDCDAVHFELLDAGEHKQVLIYFKQRTIVVVELTDSKDEFGHPDVTARRWCYRRER